VVPSPFLQKQSHNSQEPRKKSVPGQSNSKNSLPRSKSPSETLRNDSFLHTDSTTHHLKRSYLGTLPTESARGDSKSRIATTPIPDGKISIADEYETFFSPPGKMLKDYAKREFSTLNDDVQINEEESLLQSTSRLLMETDIMEDENSRAKEKILERYKFTDKETTKLIQEHVHELKSGDYIWSKDYTPLISIKTLIKWILDAYYDLINDHFISDKVLLNFRLKLRELLSIEEYLSRNKLEQFSKKKGLRTALADLLKTIIKNNEYSKALENINKKKSPIKGKLKKTAQVFDSLLELFEKNSVELRANYQQLIEKKLDKLEVK